MFLFDEGLATLKARCTAINVHFQEGRGPGEIDVRTVDPAEVSPGEFAQMVRRVVEEDNAELIIIDSLNGYLHAMPDEPFLTAQLHELLSFLARRGVTTFIVVAQHGIAVGSIQETPVDTSYLADSVILHRYYEYRGEVKRAVSVVKKRGGKHEETIRGLYFDESGIHLTEPLSQLRGVLTGVPVELEDSSSK
jgi:circadian clock protein KaiC